MTVVRLNTALCSCFTFLVRLTQSQLWYWTVAAIVLLFLVVCVFLNADVILCTLPKTNFLRDNKVYLISSHMVRSVVFNLFHVEVHYLFGI